MQRGDIFHVSLDPTKGHEQQGHRPVLVVSPDEFNSLTGMVIIVPITNGGGFARTRGFTVQLMGFGLQTAGVVRCDQPRTIDLRARGGRRIESVPSGIMEEVLAKLAPLFE